MGAKREIGSKNSEVQVEAGTGSGISLDVGVSDEVHTDVHRGLLVVLVGGRKVVPAQVHHL